jgi:hypothetical protein
VCDTGNEPAILWVAASERGNEQEGEGKQVETRPMGENGDRGADARCRGRLYGDVRAPTSPVGAIHLAAATQRKPRMTWRTENG